MFARAALFVGSISQSWVVLTFACAAEAPCAFLFWKVTNMDSGQLTNPLCACEWGFRPRRMKEKIHIPLNLSLSY